MLLPVRAVHQYSLDLNLLKCFLKFQVLKNQSYHLLEEILNSFRKKYSFFTTLSISTIKLFTAALAFLSEVYVSTSQSRQSIKVII